MTPLTETQLASINTYTGELVLFAEMIYPIRTGGPPPALPRRVWNVLSRLYKAESAERDSYRLDAGEFCDLSDHCRFARESAYPSLEHTRPAVRKGIEAIEHYLTRHAHRHGTPHRPDDRRQQGEDVVAAHQKTAAEPEAKPAPTITARIEGVFQNVDAPGLRLRTMPHDAGAMVAFEPLPGTPPFLRGYVGPYLHVSNTASDAEIVSTLYRAAEAFALDRVRCDFKYRGAPLHLVPRGDDSPVRQPAINSAAWKSVGRTLGVPRGLMYPPAVMEFGGNYRCPAERDAEAEASV